MKKLFTILAAMMCLVGRIEAQTLSKTFGWNGLTMRYPADYAITDKDVDKDGYLFNCESTDEKIIAVLTVSFYYDELLPELKRDALIKVCQEGLDGAVEAFTTEECKVLTKGDMTIDNSKSYPYVYQPFTASLSGTPIKGRVAMAIHDDMLVCVAILAQDATILSTLQSIANTIKKQR